MIGMSASPSWLFLLQNKYLFLLEWTHNFSPAGGFITPPWQRQHLHGSQSDGDSVLWRSKLEKWWKNNFPLAKAQLPFVLLSISYGAGCPVKCTPSWVCLKCVRDGAHRAAGSRDTVNELFWPLLAESICYDPEMSWHQVWIHHGGWG